MITRSGVELSPEQQQVVDGLIEFNTSPHPMIRVSGAAGTGKTTVVSHFASIIGEPIAITAPTNKATKVLKHIAESSSEAKAMTTFSLLGLRVTKDAELVEVRQLADNLPVKEYRLVVVDEWSMVNDDLMAHLSKACDNYGTKVIFTGDSYQLPPVGMDASPVRYLDQGFDLTQVMRHDSQILNFCTKLRKVIDGEEELKYKTDKDERGGVFCTNFARFRRAIEEMVRSDGFRENPGDYRIITWRNSQVNHYNDIARRAILGDAQAEESKFWAGERVIACQPITNIRDDDEILATTDSEMVVHEASVGPHPIFDNLTCYHLKLENLNAGPADALSVPAYVIHEDSEATYKRMLKDAADDARLQPRRWREFHALKSGYFQDIRPAYAITAHRSQGSTYTSALVDTGDIMSNRNTKEALRCLYVACSRASKNLILRTR